MMFLEGSQLGGVNILLYQGMAKVTENDSFSTQVILLLVFYGIGTQIL